MSSLRLAPTHTAEQRPGIAVAVLCFGGLAVALTQTLVIPIQAALPAMLGTSSANASWVITATLLVGAVTMPVAGRIADLVGKQRVLVASAVALLVGSVACALADSLVPLLFGRVLQGLAMGFIPVAISLIREITPPDRAGTAISTMSATLGIGGAIGLPLAAWIAQEHDWHAMFWLSAVFALVLALASWLLIPQIHDGSSGRLDLVGAAGLAIGLIAFLVGISKANSWGWGDPRTLGSIFGGLAVLLAWAAFELRHTEPLVDVRISLQRPVLLTNIAAIAVGFGMMAQAIVVPQLMQLPLITGYGLGQTMLRAGLWIAPTGLMMLLFSRVSSRMITRIGARLTLMMGATLLGSGYVLAVFLTDAPWKLLIASCVQSAGVAIGYAAMPTLILDAVPESDAASAVGLNSLMRSVGTSLAAAFMALVLTSSTTSIGGFAVPSEAAFRLCFIIGAAAAFAGAAITACLPARRPVDRAVPVMARLVEVG